MMDKKLIKKAIELYEYNIASAMEKLCGIEIKVVNLKIFKDKAVADIIVTENGEHLYRENKVEYPYKMLINKECNFSIGGERRC